MSRRGRWRPRGAAAVLAAVLLAVLAAPAGAAAAGAQQDAGTAEVLRIPFPHDDGSLTPYTFELGYPLVTLVYDTLAWRDADGDPQPWLAASIDVAPDARQVTVRLREGARWHDGRPVTAEDVVFTFAYVAERFHPRFTPQVAAIAAVTAVDARTAVFDLARPSPGFVDQPLADVPILPAHLWGELPDGSAAPHGLPVGSGPYRLTDHRPGQGYRFEAVTEHPLGAPAVAVIEVPVIRTASETLAALERREVDMIPLALPAQAQERVEGLGVRIVDGASYAGTTLLFNLRAPPFDDPAARRAVAATLDRIRIVRAVGDAVPADRGVLHPASPWAPDEALDAIGGADPVDLGDLGLPPLEVLAPNNDPVKVEAARQVALALSGAGADAEMVAVARDELSSRIGEDGAPPDFQLAISSSPPLASYDPDFLSAVFGAQGPLNHTGYASAEFDALAGEVATTTDPDARRGAVARQLALLARDLPVVPLFFADGAFAHRPAIYDGWVYVAGRGILDKRSFMTAGQEGGDEATPPPGDDAAPAPDDQATSPPTGGSPLGWVVAGLLAAAGALATIAVVKGRR
ncbi:MAG: ABC transporter substrate-binding protein [Egibacteraceae bacterium]